MSSDTPTVKDVSPPINFTPSFEAMLRAIESMATTPTAKDKHGRTFTIGDIVIDRDCSGSAGVITTIDGCRVLYAPMHGDDTPSGLYDRDNGFVKEVELIARRPQGFDVVNDSARGREPQECRRHDLVFFALAILRSMIDAEGAMLATAVYGPSTTRMNKLVSDATQSMRQAAGQLLAAADYTVLPIEGGAQ